MAEPLAPGFPETLQTILDFASAAGIAILSVPAFSLNFRKKKLARIKRIVQSRESGKEKRALDTIAAELHVEATEKVNRWRRADEICLLIGYLLLLGSALARASKHFG